MMLGKHFYDLASPLVSKFEPEDGESIKHTLKFTDTVWVQQSAGLNVPIIDSNSKGEAFLPVYFHQRA
jgi:hypothetical protein